MPETPICQFGWKAVDFALPDLDGKTITLADVAGPKGTLIVFLCNHCPYVRGIIERLVWHIKLLQADGIGVAAIMANDYRAYPEDAPDKMRAFAAQHGFTFPYLLDETQEVARAYGAVCTPDFFGFNTDLALQYRGRLDESKTQLIPDAHPELLTAMRQIAFLGTGPEAQTPSMGCSIKWRDAA